jgi:hypothetical protein
MISQNGFYSVPTIVRGTREQNLFLRRKTLEIVFKIIIVDITLMYTMIYVFCSLVPLTMRGTE